jgi:Holliday junction resolvase-like predicted endonuclease
METERRRRGASAELEAASFVTAHGWHVLATNVRVGRDEIDLLCIDPGPPAELVFLEVRSLRVASFGEPEERVDARKVGRLYRSMAALRAHGTLPDGTPLPRLATRVDLIVIDGRLPAPEVRHLRRLMPP